MRSENLFIFVLSILLVSCSGSDGGGSNSTNVALDESNVTVMEEGLTYELVPDGGASTGSSVQSWRWSAQPIVEGALSQCSAVEQFDLERAATGLEAACTVSGKCTLSFDQISTANVQGAGQSRFSVRIPVLKADVGVTFQLEAIDTSGQSSVANFTFCLLAINEQPSAQDDAFTVVEGAPLVVNGDSGINLLTNDSDDVYVGNEPLTVSSTPVRAPEIATSFALQPDGGFSYFFEGDADVAGGTQINDSFQYEITDGTFTTVATVNLTIVAEDNPPQLNSDLPDQLVVAGVPVEVDFSEFFSDPEEGDLFFSAIGLPASGGLVITPVGLLTGMATPADAGSYQVQIQADDQQSSAVGLFNLTVQANLPPETTPIPNQAVAFGELVSLATSEYFTDPEGIDLTFSLVSQPQNDLQINPETGLISGLVTNPGVYELTVSVDDDAGNIVSTTFTLTQQEAENRAPVFVGQIGNQSVTVNTAINPVSGEFSDPDDDELTFSINNTEPGLSFNTNTGVLSGQPTTLGISTYVITAEDPDGLSVVSNSFRITVNDVPNNAPEFSGSIASQSGQVGEPIGAISGNFSDEDNDTLTFTSTTLPAGLSINSVGTITGTPTTPGTTSVTITATDSNGASVSSNAFSIVIQPPENNPPAITGTQPSAITVETGDDAGLQVNVSDEDTSSLVYSAVSGNPSIATVSGGSNGSFTVEGISPGSTNITVTVTDDETQSTTASINVTVTAMPNSAPSITARNPAGNLSLDQGEIQVVELTVSDEDPETLEFSGMTNSASVATVTTNADNSFNITGISEGQATITLSIEDSEGLSDEVSFIVSVAPPPNGAPEITDRTPAGSLSLDPAQAQLISITVEDENPATLVYSSSSSSAAVVTVSTNANNTFTVTGVAEGQATVTLQITDEEELSDSVSIAVTVEPPPNGAPEINSRTPAGSITLEPGQGSNVSLDVSDEDEATVVYLAESSDTDIATVVVNADNSFLITGVSNGTAQVTLTVRDLDGLEDSVVVPVEVDTDNLPPSIDAIDPPGNAALEPGEEIMVTLTVSDESTATLDFSASSDNADAATVSADADGVYTVTAVADGVATITFTVADADGLEDTASIIVNVTTANLAPQITDRDPDTNLILGEGDSETVTLTVDDESIATLVYTASSTDTDVARVTAGGGGSYTVTAQGPGTATIRLRVTDAEGLFDTDRLTVMVAPANAAPQIVNRTPAGVIGLAPAEATTVSLTVTDEDVATLVYTADINGSGVARVDSLGDGKFLVTAGAAALENATVELTVTDSDGLSATETIMVEITAPPTIEAGLPASDLVLTSDGSEIVTLSVAAGSTDTLQYTAQSSQPGVVAVSSVDNVYTIEALTSGQATVTFTVTDDSGRSDSDTIQVIVDDPPLIVSRAPAGLLDLPEGASLQVSLVVNDEALSTIDVQASSGDSLIASVLVTGDNVVEVFGQGSGSTTISISVTDERGQSDNITIPVDVTESVLAAARFTQQSDVEATNGDNMISVIDNTVDVLPANN